MHENEMIHERYNASWVLNSEQELIEAVKKLSEKPDFKPYTEMDVKKFVNEVVYNGPDGDDVLGGYRSYILNAKKEFLQIG